MTVIINPTIVAEILNSLSITHIGLHSDVTGDTGLLNELNSINYARTVCSFSQPTGGARVLENTVSFTLSGGDSVSYVSYWNNNSFVMSQQTDLAVFSISGKFEVRATDTVLTL